MSDWGGGVKLGIWEENTKNRCLFNVDLKLLWKVTLFVLIVFEPLHIKLQRVLYISMDLDERWRRNNLVNLQSRTCWNSVYWFLRLKLITWSYAVFLTLLSFCATVKPPLVNDRFFKSLSHKAINWVNHVYSKNIILHRPLGK